ncbi:MarR family transcriptional regulator [Humibacter sp. BT305]|nr:MarR family transcriptional regulator [Humibacter sp. BT305]
MTVDLEALGHAVKRAQYRNHRTMDAVLREAGVSLVQWDALRTIERMPRASNHDLAVATFQSDQAFGALAARLVDRGLITRTAGQGRRIEHSLTAGGHDALEHGHRLATTTLEELFAPLDEAQRAALEQILASLIEDDQVATLRPLPGGARSARSR